MYRLDTDEGQVSLQELFRGRSQLLVYHFMFGPDYKAGCPSCSAIADGFNGFAAHLANHDVMLWAISRAPLAKLQGYKQRMQWTFPWASSFESDFNYDCGVAFTEEQQQSGVVEHNYRAMDTRSELRDRTDTKPSYITWLEWRDGRISFIRDYRYVRYTIADAELALAPDLARTVLQPR